jgi:hypothetical protein
VSPGAGLDAVAKKSPVTAPARSPVTILTEPPRLFLIEDLPAGELPVLPAAR